MPPTTADNTETLTEGSKSEDGSFVPHEDEEEKFESPVLQPQVIPVTETIVRDSAPVQNHTTVNGGDLYDIGQLEDELNQLDFEDAVENHVSSDVIRIS